MNWVMETSDGDAGASKPAETRDSAASKREAEAGIRVLLADDHPVVRWGLSCCIATRKELVIVGEAASGAEAVRKAKELHADVVLMDIDMPGMDGLTATEILHREQPEVKVLLLSMHPFTGQMGRIIQSGARGFLLKNTKPAEVVTAICKVAAGHTCFGDELAVQALNQLATNGGTIVPNDKGLSAREREVLIGIAEGLGNKEIAARLGISARTVETHRGHIMQKLKIHSIAGLTRYAVSIGLVMLKEDKGQ